MIRSVLLPGLIMITAGATTLFAEQPRSPAPAAAWFPRYLCLCPDLCEKPIPRLPCWCYTRVCDDYCRKAIPCLTAPCVNFCCDDYQCKPAPCCWPPGPCPPRWNFVERLPPVPAADRDK